MSGRTARPSAAANSVRGFLLQDRHAAFAPRGSRRCRTPMWRIETKRPADSRGQFPACVRTNAYHELHVRTANSVVGRGQASFCNQLQSLARNRSGQVLVPRIRIDGGDHEA
jgi:hypothetical protein